MRVLLDTHVLIWWVLDSPRLSATAKREIGQAADVYVSVASVWEMSIKVGSGKWPEAQSTLDDFEPIMDRLSFAVQPITVTHARAAGAIVSPHRDPFDRLLAAQALTESQILVSADPRLAALGAEVLR